MEAKDLKSVVDFIIRGAEGKQANLSDEVAVKFDRDAAKLFVDTSLDLLTAKFAPIMNMDIRRLNIHFFDNLPYVWMSIQNTAEVKVRAEKNEEVEEAEKAKISEA